MWGRQSCLQPSFRRPAPGKELLAPRRVFLSAEWRYLAMLNYAVHPALLQEHIPDGTELDHFDGRTFVSLVGFRFLRTRVFGFSFPFHRDFDEVNLRFYLRREVGGEVRRGVAFIREIVPRRAIAQIARLAYGEQYVSLPMRHAIETGDNGIRTEYEWRIAGGWNRLHARAGGPPAYPTNGGLGQFITEHYWGYSRQPRGGTMEYRVDHVPWRVWSCTEAAFEGDATALYGSDLSSVIAKKPDSAFIAEGSPVQVYVGQVAAGRKLS